MGISKKAIISGKDILDYIPQRHPIVMVDEFLGIEDNISTSALTITKDNIFCKDNELIECGIIEHIAQSAALRIGYIYKNAGKTIPIGFIGSVNDFTLSGNAKVDDKIVTEIKVEKEIMNISLVSALVRNGENTIAQCAMKIYLQE